ncbi:hypothetical protein Ancab_008828 [Ancistrocladus abbreviatus]
MALPLVSRQKAEELNHACQFYVWLKLRQCACFRSTKANDVDKQVYGGLVPVLEGEKFSIRVLVDHSIVEAFGQGGRTCMRSQIYPAKAIDGAARVFLFNNAIDLNITASIKIWHMASVNLRLFPLDQM